MISVSIFALRDVIRQVQSNFKTPYNGKTHTSPSTAAEISLVRDYLQTHKLQEYMPNRENNSWASPVRDLMETGATYANTASAFRNFTKTKQRAYYKEQRLQPPSTIDPSIESDEDEEEDEDPDLGGPVNIDLYDLSADTDEFPEGCDPSEMVDIIEKMVDSMDL